MSDLITDDKLGSKLGHSEITKTRTFKKFRLKFTDFAIKNFTADFINDKGKTLKRVYVPFDHTKNSFLKGLKLVQFQKTKAKYFILRYWYNSKSGDITLGQFEEDKFGVKQVQETLFDLVKKCTNDKNLWIKDPRSSLNKQFEEEKEESISAEEMLSVNQVIERLCKANFPKARDDRRLSAINIQTHIKYLIGYNWRSHHLITAENNQGSGLVSFKANIHKRTAKPDDWDDLFKKFPPGKGIIKGPNYLNPKDERSVYDSPLGQVKIDEMTTSKIKSFIRQTDKSYGTEKNIKNVFRTLWAFAEQQDLFVKEIPENPVKKIRLIKPSETKSPGSRYNDLRFSDEEIQTIWTKLIELKDRYPFQAEALLFMLCTGRRAEETMKIRRSNLTKDGTRLIMPSGITKARKQETIYITEPIRFVLDMLDEKLNGEYQKYKFVDWLFPTTRINSKQLHSDKYVRSDQTRLKELRGCWSALIRETSIKGAPKMLRKTFSSIAKLALGTSSKAIQLTGHEQESTLETYYDKHTPEQVREYAEQVGEYFKFKKG